MSQPGFFFYTGDWVKDTRVLSAEERGCWVDALCFLKEHGGSVTWPVASYARFWSISVERACEVLDRLSDLNVAEVEWQTDGKTDGKNSKAIAKLSNRRMLRLAEHEESNRQHIHDVRSEAGKKGAEKKWQTHGKNGNLPSLLLTQNKSLKKDPEPATPGPVDKSVNPEPERAVKQAPIVLFESTKFSERAKKICGKTPDHLNKLIEWILSMKSAMPTEPMERVNAVVGLSLEALERHIESGRPIHSLWGLLTTIFDSERTKYMQGPENEGHKSGAIPAEVQKLARGIG